MYKGQFVMEYKGILVDMKTAKHMEANYCMDKKKGCFMYYFKHNDKPYW